MIGVEVMLIPILISGFILAFGSDIIRLINKAINKIRKEGVEQ
jgi:hypothetical protein